jgi:C-terminal processing protease CtpA/Prc
LRTAQGRRLDGSGVKPDIEPPQTTLEDLRQGRDPDVDAALRILRQP